MYTFHSLAMAATAITTFSSVVNGFDALVNTNMAVYWVRSVTLWIFAVMGTNTLTITLGPRAKSAASGTFLRGFYD